MELSLYRMTHYKVLGFEIWNREELRKAYHYRLEHLSPLTYEWEEYANSKDLQKGGNKNLEV